MGRKALFGLFLRLSCGPVWDFSDSLYEYFIDSGVGHRSRGIKPSCTQRYLWCLELLTFEKRSGGIAGVGVCVDDVLASVRGVVDLSPHKAPR
jgi:hypothetical protein